MANPVSLLNNRRIRSKCDPSFADPFNNPEFLSKSKASELLRRDTIGATLRASLSEQPAGTIERYINYVENGAGNVFLILVWLNQTPRLRSLCNEGFKDEHLPIFCENPQALDHEPLRYVTFRNGNKHGPWTTFMSPFSPNDDVEAFASSFETRQWTFLAPSFFRNELVYNFKAQQPLPFVMEPRPLSAEGNFGLVRRVQIPNGHQDYIHQGPFVVAVKILKNDAKMEDFYEKEKKTLQTMKTLRHRHLIQALATYRRGLDRGFVFPWANGGSLSQLWARDRAALDHALLSWTLSQIKGLVEGIKLLHDKRTRHGDLKPDNILVFSESNIYRGDLVVADVGLAKFHALYTRERYDPTTTRHGSRRYEPPEVEERAPKFSRKYDMWSLGCILLEMVIWVLHGYSGLQRFFQDTGYNAQFWETTPYPQLRPIIGRWVNALLKTAQNDRFPRDFMLARILVLIKEQLLQVKVDSRAYSQDLWRQIQMIDGNLPLDASFVFQSTLDELTPVKPDTATEAQDPKAQLSRISRNEINDIWEIVTDNSLAATIFRQLEWKSPVPHKTVRHICKACRDIDLRSDEIDLGRTLDVILSDSDTCDICGLLVKCLSKIGIKSSETVRLFHRNFSLSTSQSGPPLISIYSDLVSNKDITSVAQIGRPQLPKASSPEQLRLLNGWVRVCDERHPCTRMSDTAISALRVPTRLIYLGNDQDPRIRLVEPSNGTNHRYIALSHCWGQVSEEFDLRTTTDNIENFKKEIGFKQLPGTFRDAVIITRALGVYYLWIDSLCIIQGDRNDWQSEANKMEDYYSSAYVTIAATSGESSVDGMFFERPERAFATLQTAYGPVYLAEFMDDFQADVQKAVLNTRAWVLQERALSRRTIHFTSNQIYWECGNGVHCETLAQLRNPQAQFLGDHNFPHLGLTYFKNERIQFIQYLHSLYSGLSLTKNTDRGIAIAGLHKRIARTFSGRFDYGIYWKYFERSILWRAQSHGGLSWINYTAGYTVPSWSWMAYLGKIEYLDIPYGKVDWTGDLVNPIPPGTGVGDVVFSGYLSAIARPLTIDDENLKQRVVMDTDPRSFLKSHLMCIVVGKHKPEESLREVPHYVLVVRAADGIGSDDLYNRVGVGILTTSHISTETKKVRLI